MAIRKFSVILLVVLVASQCTAASIPDMIKGIMDSMKEDMQKMEASVKDLVQRIEKELQKFGGQVRDDVQKIEEQMQNEIKQATQNVDRVVSCIAQERNNISSIYSDAEKDVEKCVLKAGVKLFPLINKVNATIQKTKQDFNEVVSDLQKPECRGSFQATIGCILAEVPKVQKDVQERGKEVQAEVQQARDAIPQLIQVGQECVQKIVQDARSKIRAIYDEIRTCAMKQ